MTLTSDCSVFEKHLPIYNHTLYVKSMPSASDGPMPTCVMDLGTKPQCQKCHYPKPKQHEKKLHPTAILQTQKLMAFQFCDLRFVHGIQV